MRPRRLLRSKRLAISCQFNSLFRQRLLSIIAKFHPWQGLSNPCSFSVTSGEGHSGSHDVSRSRTTTPHTHSTESDPINPTYSQNSLPVIRMHPEEDTVLTIRVPLTDKPIGSYDSPGSVPGTSRVLRSVTGSQPDMMSVRAPRYIYFFHL